MSAPPDQPSGRAVPEDLAALVLRADRLGFCPRRVATALEISASGFAAIEQRGALAGGNGPWAAQARQVSR